MMRSSVLTVLLILALAAPAALAQDFSRYVAIGDSLTAGYSSGGLAVTQQAYSYPALLHAQFGSLNPMEQPTISAPGLGFDPTLGPVPQLELKSLAGGVPVIKPITGAPGVPTNLTYPAPYTNLGIPGASVGDVLGTYCGGFFDLVLRNQGCPSPGATDFNQLQQALAQNPTFMTIWIGANDVLGAATSGIINDQTLTPLADFQAAYSQMIGALVPFVMDGELRLAIANIPNVASIPYVTTLPPVVVNPATGQVVTDPSGNPVPLIGTTWTGEVRALTFADRVLLPASAELAQGIGIPSAVPGGTGQPLDDRYVLDADELGTILARTQQMNDFIFQEANRVQAAFVDAYSILTGVALQGFTLGGIDFDSSFLTGGVFSYDGVHATSLGYGVLANAFITAINARYGATVPLANLADFVFGSAGANSGMVMFPPEMVRGVIYSEEAADSLAADLAVEPYIAPTAEEVRELRRQGGDRNRGGTGSRRGR